MAEIVTLCDEIAEIAAMCEHTESRLMVENAAIDRVENAGADSRALRSVENAEVGHTESRQNQVENAASAGPHATLGETGGGRAYRGSDATAVAQVSIAILAHRSSFWLTSFRYSQGNVASTAQPACPTTWIIAHLRRGLVTAVPRQEARQPQAAEVRCWLRIHVTCSTMITCSWMQVVTMQR